jgi:hypothetical protein
MFLISAFKVSDRSNAEDQNKIVQRFYQTPAPLKAGRDLKNERLKFLSPQAPKAGFTLLFNKLRGISEFLPQPTGLWYRTFALKRILYFI